MDRKNEIRISLDTTTLSQVFIHTSGAYLDKPISTKNNNYLANHRNIPSDQEFESLIKKIAKTKQDAKRQILINDLKSRLDIDRTINAIPLTFANNIEQLNGYIVFEPTSAIENYNLSLLDFISYNFDNFNDYLLFFINFFDYFIDKLDNKDIKYIEIDTLYPVKEIIEIAEKYYKKEKNNLIYYQSIFKKCIHFVYCIDNPFDLTDLTLKQRFFLYNQLYQDTFKEFSHNFHTTDLLEYQYNNFPLKKDEVQLEDVYTLISVIKEIDSTGKHLSNLHQFITNNLFTSFYITLFNLVAINKLHIKICGNCNRYFLTPKENVSYCNRIITENQTCKDVGNKEYQKRKQDNDDTYRKYRTIGTRKKTRASRNPEIDIYQKDLEQFRKVGKQMYKDVCDGKISNEEFAKWVDEQDK